MNKFSSIIRQRMGAIRRVALVTTLSLVAFGGLVGCSDPAPESVKVAEPVTSNDYPTDPATVYIQPTKIPNDEASRAALLTKLNAKLANALREDNPDDWPDERLRLFVSYTQLANDPNRQLKPLEILLAQIDKAHFAHADDHELKALLGSATSLQTVFFLNNLGKTQLLAKQGGRDLDRAIKSAPHHLGVRLYRGITYAEMPDFLGKARQAVTDFRLLKAKMDPQLGADFAAMVDYYLGMALLKNNQRAEGMALLAAVVASNSSPWSARATALINEKA